ncbi:MAG TPA: trypsin-like serine protease [Kofleriaceae bacterium]|nr:trypsin-like serine protease [Kofleriaceae bacterium]
MAPISLSCALALAQPPGKVEVIGGTNAPAGVWPDAVGVLYRDNPQEPALDEALCSGTLIAPTVVLTAGHCFEGNLIPDNVLIGASTLKAPSDGETIAVRAGFVYPDAGASEDITVLVLAQPSTKPPRAIATGWAAADIQNGAKVELVGFGAIDANASNFVDELQQAETTITDFDCSKSSGCHSAARPAGELGAGGMGVDTCPGDSGGPLYLRTRYGTYLAGVTSRSYDDAKVMCSDGGIYARPDKIVPWIEQVAGVPVSHGPEPTVGALVVPAGGCADTKIEVNDPASTDHDFDIPTLPAHVQAGAGADRDGKLRVCIDDKNMTGATSFQVTLIDRTANRSLSLTVPVTIAATTPGATCCDLDGFPRNTADSGGCCNTGHGTGGAIPLAIGVLAFVARRRRR